uniref:Chaperone protein dnaJ 2 n=1 Tax=Magallana gigas TaxID=29159 RepID=K1R2L1_MAGGI
MNMFYHAVPLHPDANPGDSKAQQKFVRLQEAYSTLSDPREKARYDVQMYRDIQERAKTKQKQNNYSTTTHTTENLSEQETIQRYYRQHQEQYEEWLRKTRQQADNRHQQQHQHNPNDWSGWENPNPDDPFYEYHPDANPNDPQAQQKFVELQKAYEILSEEKTL